MNYLNLSLRSLALLLLHIIIPRMLHAQLPNKPVPGTVWITFFSGKWHGEGSFANGRKITANVSFRILLDSCWLINEHEDEVPNRYKALSVWGFDKETGKLTVSLFDNFGGHREFTGGAPAGGAITFTRSVANGSSEHFIYRKLDDNSFRMSYEVNKGGKGWIPVDSLVFKRTGS